ncbi:MAG TPA: hypothetical protein EYN38_02120, partial [Flavobacteriales bacterium]|nr:hypothetical protein [Flavobacteriales bacterium]
KKIAGTLKLDQAQYRELEAFAKFGSDLDAATQAVIDKGQRNVEILKQGQYEPLSVELQQAIIYLGTNGLMLDVPVKEIKEFELNFLDIISANHKDVLQSLKEGKITDVVTQTLEKVAADMTSKYRSSRKQKDEEERGDSQEGEEVTEPESGSAEG